MLHIKNISLFQFKNHSNSNYDFQKPIVAFVGHNGSGKTSILDAIYFLCFTKSYFTFPDSLCVQYGESEMSIRGLFFKNNDGYDIACKFRNQRKEFLIDQHPYQQLSKHIGLFPCVIIAPDDTKLITEGSEVRRKLFDLYISQIHPSYLNWLLEYNKLLSQRNALLKRWHINSSDEKSMLDLYNQQMIPLAQQIMEQRKQHLHEYGIEVLRIYQQLSGQKEKPSLHYESQLLHHNMEELFEQSLHKDIILQRTSCGIHKDDLIFKLNEATFKQVASQGQRKTFLFSLKLAMKELLAKHLHLEPILLLDDVFEKLDAYRSQQIIDYIVASKSQIFITDTHLERIQSTFKPILQEVQIIEL
ncbi:MAG: DNA replication and repair protein RecF [Chitinophagaceae bacterium]